MLKRFFCLVLSLALVCGAVSAQADFLSDAVGWVTQAADTVSQTVQDVAGSASGALSDAWAWLRDTVAGTGEKAGELWEKTKEYWQSTSGQVADAVTGLWDSMKSWLNTDALPALQTAYESVGSALGVAQSSVTGLWNQLNQYAQENNIQPITILKLGLVVLQYIPALQGTANSAVLQGIDLGTEVTELLVAMGITDQTSAQDALNGLLSTWFK